MKRVYITLDCDRGESTINRPIGMREAVRSCYDLFITNGFEKVVTWFVNESDIGFTSNYPDLLDIMAEGEIGLHVHFNRPPFHRFSIPDEKALIDRMIKEPKDRLETWLSESSGQKELLSFRSGNLLTNSTLFSSLEELGFSVDSSIPSQFDWSVRESSRRILNNFPGMLKKFFSGRAGGAIYNTLPLGATPYIIGKMKEMPIHIYIGGRYADLNWLKKRTMKQMALVDDLVVYWHPYEIIEFGADLYEDYLQFLKDNWKINFKTLSKTLQQ